jgi:hypothetical protein
MLAEKMVDSIGMIVNQFSSTGYHTKGIGFYDNAPYSGLSADFAIAPECARFQVNVGFEANRAAVAASFVCPFHWSRVKLIFSIRSKSMAFTLR